MQLLKTLCVGLTSALFLNSCALFNAKEIIVTGQIPLQKIKKQFKINKIWSASSGEGTGAFYSHLHPAFHKSNIFTADRHGIVKSLNAQNGSEQWSVDLSENRAPHLKSLSALLSGGLTVSGEKIYVGSEKALVYALNIHDGRLIWQTTVAGEALSTPVISNGMVLIHTSNGRLQALNESDGVVQWTFNLDMSSMSLRGESAPAVAFGAAIVGSDNGYVSAISMQKGQLIWKQRIARSDYTTDIDQLNDIDAAPMITQGIVYALAYNNNLAALDLRSGEIIWKRELGSVNDFIVSAGRIYIIDKNDYLIALRASDGVTVWTQSHLLHRKLTAPVMFNGYLVAADAAGYLNWINATDGYFSAQHSVDSSGFLSAPLVAGDRLVIQARSGQVHTFT